MSEKKAVYEKIDENRIKQIETHESEIYLDKLEAEIEDLQKQLESIPKPKTKPDQETLDFWNEMHIREDKEELEEELREKEKLLKKLKRL